MTKKHLYYVKYPRSNQWHKTRFALCKKVIESTTLSIDIGDGGTNYSELLFDKTEVCESCIKAYLRMQLSDLKGKYVDNKLNKRLRLKIICALANLFNSLKSD